MTLRIFIGPALAMLGRLTGLRVWHFATGAAALALALAALVVPFWLFAQAAAPTLGLLAFLIALLAYGMCAAALVAASAVLTGRVVLERFRRALTLR